MKTFLKAESTGFLTGDHITILPGSPEVWRKACGGCLRVSATLPQAGPTGVDVADVQ